MCSEVFTLMNFRTLIIASYYSGILGDAGDGWSSYMVRITSDFIGLASGQNLPCDESRETGRVPSDRSQDTSAYQSPECDEGGEVAQSDIVKGYEYAKNRYIEIDPDELKALRIPTATTMQIKQFVKADELSTELFDRPYFVVPKDDVQAKALGIMRKAIAQTDTFGIGEIAFSGREHLVAVGAPSDPKQKGLMLYTLRYENELRDSKSALAGVKGTSVDASASELSLAKQLINRKHLQVQSRGLQGRLRNSSEAACPSKT